ncbi:hypothetical protein V6Z11_D11G192300 [Gossypium hirsutum]
MVQVHVFTITCLCIRIAIISLYVKTYFSLFRRMRISGKHSLDLWGPDDGFGACIDKYNEYKIKMKQHRTRKEAKRKLGKITYECTTKLVEHPMPGGTEPLQVFLQPSSLKEENFK